MAERLRCQTCDYDLCNKCQGHPDGKAGVKSKSGSFMIGDTVTVVECATSSPLQQDVPPIDPTPKPGMKVTAISGKSGAPSGKPTLAFSKGEKLTITKVREEKGEWYAVGHKFDTLWFPLNSTDWKSRVASAAPAVGCCAVTLKSYSAGLKVIRGPGLLSMFTELAVLY